MSTEMKKQLLVIFALLFSFSNAKSQDSIKHIPDRALYYFYQLELNDFSISFPEKTKIHPKKYQAYYAKNESTPYTMDQHYMAKKCNPRLADTLKSYLLLELINDSDSKKRVFNPNELPVPIVKYLKKARSLKLEIGLHYVNILKKLDSMQLFEQERIDSLVNANWPYEAIEGFSHYSPSRKNIVRFDLNTLTYQHNEACELNLFKNINDAYEKILHVRFKSWMASKSPLDYYWISENELIFKACPIRQFVNYYNGKLEEEDISYQTIKMTILP